MCDAHPDAHLIGACARWRRNRAALAAAQDAGRETEICQLDDLEELIGMEVCAINATTLEGLKAKASLLWDTFGSSANVAGDVMEALRKDYTVEVIPLSIALDVLMMLERE